MSSSWPKEDLYWFLGHLVKGQGQMRTLNFAKFPHYNYYLLNYNDESDDTWSMCCLWYEEQPYWFWGQGQT